MTFSADRINRSTTTGILFAAFFSINTAHAQLDDLLKRSESAGANRGAGGPGGIGDALSGQSMMSGSTGNVAGVLQFCIRNNYLGGDAVSSVKNSLMGKVPGATSSTDSGYVDGEKGILKSSNGKQLELGGSGGASGMKAKVTKQVCDAILGQAKSLL